MIGRMLACADPHSAIFEEHRPFLLSVAYRMLGTMTEAEDIVSDAYLRWLEVDTGAVKAPKAYLARTVTRLCINYLQSARVRREHYVGPWLPEPLVTTAAAGDPVELSESLTMAFLVLLESLSPIERAVLLLSDVFDYTIDEISEAVGKTSVNCRQILHRAREAVNARRPKFEARKEDAVRLIDEFGKAVAGGDLNHLLALIHSDAVLMTDGGGKVRSALNPIYGAEKIARFFLGIAKKRAGDSFELTMTEINREPGLILRHKGAVESTMIFHIEDGRIRSLFTVSNPDKLASLEAENAHAVTTDKAILSFGQENKNDQTTDQ